MEWAIVFEALCTVTDCAWQKIGKGVLLLGAVCGAAAAGWRMVQTGESWYEIMLSVVPGAVLYGLSRIAEGKVGRGDGDMVLILGLLLGWELCLAVISAACLLAAVFAGGGLAMGRLKKSSRIPFAPFLLSASVLIWCCLLTG